MESISKRLGPQPNRLFHIAYMKGAVKQEWKRFFAFHKVETPYEFLRSKSLRLLLYTYGRNKHQRQVKDLDVDLIYSLNGFWHQDFARKFSRRRRVPYVVRLRGDFMEGRKIIVDNPIKRWILDHVDVRGLKQADLLIPISRRLARAAEDWGLDKEKISEPVPLGVDAEFFRPMEVERPSDFIVGYAGRIAPEKGINRLVKIAQKLPDVHFIIAGKQEMPVSFPTNVEYLGELSFQEMPVFYNKVDLLVLPSLMEGFPSVILEAYVCEKPILATFEAVPEEVQVFGAVGDISSFPELIKKIQTWSLQSLGKRAREYVKRHYTWEKFARSIVDHLKSVLDQTLDR